MATLRSALCRANCWEDTTITPVLNDSQMDILVKALAEIGVIDFHSFRCGFPSDDVERSEDFAELLAGVHGVPEVAGRRVLVGVADRLFGLQAFPFV